MLTHPLVRRKSFTSEGKAPEQDHKYGCLMLDVPPQAGQGIERWAWSTVSLDDCIGDGLQESSEYHITLKYGFPDDPDLPQLLTEVLRSYGPFAVTVQGVSSFPDSGDGAVLKLDVASDDLFTLYHYISDNFPARDKWYPDYKPHVTLAYLNPEEVSKYEGLRCPFVGLSFTVVTGVYSTPSKAKVPIQLQGSKTMSWIAGNGSHLVPPPEFSLKPQKPVMNRIRWERIYQSVKTYTGPDGRRYCRGSVSPQE